MRNYTSNVNVFQGNGKIDLPKPEGIAATWHFIKGISGNTHPGAQLPFGKYSCCLHTRAYPTGYGINKANAGGYVCDYLHDKLKFYGLALFHQSGTGRISVYYNYALTSPAYGKTPVFTEREVVSESANPGYYCVGTDGILCEATVSEKAVLHRYTFDKPDANISIDFAQDGLYQADLKEVSTGQVWAVSSKELRAEMILHGIKWYFVVTCENADSSCVYDADGNCADSLTKTEATFAPLIGTFTFANAGVKILKLTSSNKSMEHAIALSKAENTSFDQMKENASAQWNQALSTIDIKTDDARELEVFYSNLYHTLVKPADFTGEPFLPDYEENEADPPPHCRFLHYVGYLQNTITAAVHPVS